MSVLDDTRKLSGPRLSELSRCPRMVAYRALGAVAEEPTDEQRRYLSRGQLFGVYVAEQYAAKYGKANVLREVEIEWPLDDPIGVGHADVLVVPERLIVEVFSTVTVGGASVKPKIEQARQYVRFSPDADLGAVHVVNPADLSRERAFPVILTDEDTARIDQKVLDVRAAIAGGPLPDRVCQKPGEAIGRFCPFAETCFEDWEEPPLIELGPEHADLARAAYDVDRACKASTAAERLHKGERANLLELLADRVPAGQDVVCGQVKLRRSEVAGRTTYDVGLAIEAGVVDGEALEPFKTVGRGHDRWRLDLLDPVASEQDADFEADDGEGQVF